jgi:hypothetical protein
MQTFDSWIRRRQLEVGAIGSQGLAPPGQLLLATRRGPLPFEASHDQQGLSDNAGILLAERRDIDLSKSPKRSIIGDSQPKKRSRDRVLQITAYVQAIFVQAVDQDFLLKDPARKVAVASYARPTAEMI